MEKRYRVITHSRDSGTDEKLDYTTQANAECAAREYRLDGYYDGVCIYDMWRNRVVKSYGMYKFA